MSNLRQLLCSLDIHQLVNSLMRHVKVETAAFFSDIHQLVDSLMRHVKPETAALFSDIHHEAMSWVRNRRFCISLNEGFQHQLREYEHIYKAQVLSPVSENTSQSIGGSTRKRKEMDGEPAPSTFPLVSS
ncbi:serine/threonine/tyrosine-interacting protein [Plakobranchus ocellatus]|uniref:Serine/threonine/tyrosine-interacting protein n=1 Tax=Plakobranchus ocellatus TaxID=259542 RepID=A0AAV3ZZ09_9GAST|nr:serine/threonine/tyrosine-interacting protein [Plakobranchus ocellatus]